MKISRRTIKRLGELITGNGEESPYRSGPQLVDFFVEFGVDDVYEAGFPSRWQYAESKISEFNDTPTLKKIIEAAVDQRDFVDSEFNLETAVNKLNEFLGYDGFELKKLGHSYRVIDLKGMMVEPETISETEHERVRVQIEKCQNKIENQDYDGAITNARTMVEEIMIKVIEEHEGKEIKNSGDLMKLYKEVKKILNLNPDKSLFSPTIVQILSGLNSIVNGLAGLSNDYGDRHANKNIASKHHAKLAVNAAMTLADFLIDSKNYQEKRKQQ